VERIMSAVTPTAAGRLRPGMAGEEVFALVAEGVRARHPDGRFPHHAGHENAYLITEDGAVDLAHLDEGATT
jgi:hypothetical protein